MLLERGHPVRIERKARKIADQSSAMLHEPMHINKIFLVQGEPTHPACGWRLLPAFNAPHRCRRTAGIDSCAQVNSRYNVPL